MMTNTRTVTFNPLTHKIVPIEPTDLMINEGEFFASNSTLCYRDMIAAAPEYQDSQWMPIETAPKNKYILVCQSRNGITRVACGTDEYGNWKTGSSIMSYIAEVTHWMPLPTPPNSEVK
jgi:hypothetical protein